MDDLLTELLKRASPTPTLGLQRPPDPGPIGLPPGRPISSWDDAKRDPLSAMIEMVRGAVTGSAPPGTNAQGFGALLAAATPFARLGKAAQEVGAARKIRAFHGSPHDFDKFSMSKIGTGEGSQAYGRGLYFAENEGVARSYRDQLSKSARASDKRNPGRMYEVEIDADPDALLDWDKPLSQQAPAPQRATEDLLDSRYGKGTFATYAENDPRDLLANFDDLDESEMTRELLRRGVPGIKYLDAGSRGAGSGTRNFVVFDDSLVTILKKYGVALPMIEGLRQKAQAGGGAIPVSDVEGLVQQ
jgi:hypothetical protein